MPFRRGDANVDQTLDLGDAVAILGHVFVSGALSCRDAADCNDDGLLDVADPIFLLTHLFVGGPQPPAPADPCGPDPTADTLECVLGCP